MEFLRRRLGLILRTGVSAVAVYWVATHYDWATVWKNMLSMHVLWLVAGALCFIPTLLIVSWRWQLLLAVQGVKLRFWRVLELTMIGQFFSTVGVGATGGDVFKIFYVTRAVPQRKAAVAFTVILDRVIGLIALLLFGVALSCTILPLLMSRHDTKVMTGSFYFFALGGVAAGVLGSMGPYLFKHPGLRALLKRLPGIHRGTSLFAAYEHAARAIGTNVTALLVSIPSHMSITLMGYCILRAMDLDPPLLAFCSLLAVVNMLVALPVSISGIGLREVLFTKFFSLVDVGESHAVVFSITFFALNILWCLLGGPFYFLYRHETHEPAPHPEEVEPIFSER